MKLSPTFIPTMMMVLSVGASLVYGVHGEWKRALYWGAAAVLTWAVTY